MLKKLLLAGLAGGGAGGVAGTAGTAEAAQAGMGEKALNRWMAGKKGPLKFMANQPAQSRTMQLPMGSIGKKPGDITPFVPQPPPVQVASQNMMEQNQGQVDPMAMGILQSLYR